MVLNNFCFNCEDCPATGLWLILCGGSAPTGANLGKNMGSLGYIIGLNLCTQRVERGIYELVKEGLIIKYLYYILLPSNSAHLLVRMANG